MLTSSNAAQATRLSNGLLFEELPSSKTGITWRHSNGRSPEYYLPETAGARCAFIDYDNDGRMDIYLPDDQYVHQLGALDVDIVAYQDEVGARKSKTSETSAFYEGLRRAHDRSHKAKLWAEVEIFDCEGEVYKTALVPALFDRVKLQLEAVSPWVDKILVCRYLGMMNQPGTTAFAGSEGRVLS